MGNRLVIIFPLLILISIIAYSIYFMAPYYVIAVWPQASKYLEAAGYGHIVKETIEPYVPQTAPDELFEKINQYRVNQNLDTFVQDNITCTVTGSLNTGQTDPNSSSVFGICTTCTHAALLSISKYASPNQIIGRMLEENTARETIEDPNLTHLCIRENQTNLSLFFARHKDNATNNGSDTPLQTTNPTPQQISKPSFNPTNFTEDQLWQALIDYRHAHQRSDLIRDENICQYARKRVQDHVEGFENKSPEEYPVPDKYPLDAHAGFAADADSGYVFDVTGKNRVAENLAFWPNATSPIHVIEWGWDTSTEGHRETQLSEDYSSACISGQDGFYVAIFGN